MSGPATQRLAVWTIHALNRQSMDTACDASTACHRPQLADTGRLTPKKCSSTMETKGQTSQHIQAVTAAEASHLIEHENAGKTKRVARVHRASCRSLDTRSIDTSSLHDEARSSQAPATNKATLADLAAACTKVTHGRADVHHDAPSVLQFTPTSHRDVQNAESALRSILEACAAWCVLPNPNSAMVVPAADEVTVAPTTLPAVTVVPSAAAGPDVAAMTTTVALAATAPIAQAVAAEPVSNRWVPLASTVPSSASSTAQHRVDAICMQKTPGLYRVVPTSPAQGLLPPPMLLSSTSRDPAMPKQQRPARVWRRITHKSCLWSMYVPEGMAKLLLPDIGTGGEEHGYALSTCADENGGETTNRGAAAGHASSNGLGHAVPVCGALAQPKTVAFHTKIMVIDLHQKCWPVKFSFHVTPKQYHRKLGQGWHDFCVAHGVRVGDAVEFRRLSGRLVSVQVRVLKRR